MTLPPWRGSEEAMIRFVIGELEREDEDHMYDFADAFLKASSDPEFIVRPRDQLEAETLARKHGGRINWPEDKVRRGNPGLIGNYARAVRDVDRIRQIFRRYWPDKDRRTAPPTAEQIAAKRWGLSDKETTKLHKKFQRG